MAVVRLQCLSNFTDFDVLERDGRFHPYYTDQPNEIAKADIIILPGSKNTIADMQMLRDNGAAETIIQAYHDGKKVIGICGGYQMLGKSIEDPNGVEGERKSITGLGLLPLQTVITREKITEQRTFRFHDRQEICQGYEIHMGRTAPLPSMPACPLNRLENGEQDGYRKDENCWGTYMHGILDNAPVRDALAAAFNMEDMPSFDYTAFKEQQYDLLAAHVRSAVDMKYIYSTLYPEN